jgi:hypothetical protein
MPKTTKFSDLVERSRKRDPATWDANVAEYQRAAEDANALGKLLEKSGNVTKVDLIAELGLSQGNASRKEYGSEMYLSTLRSYIEMLDGRLEIAAVFPDDTHRVPVAIGGGPDATTD